MRIIGTSTRLSTHTEPWLELRVGATVMVACSSGLDIAMRRFLIVSALWLGLFGVADPVLACAMNTAASECCPTGSPAPCDQDSDQSTALAPADLCCASAPLSRSLAVPIKKRDAKPPHESWGSADIPVIASPADKRFVPLSRLATRLQFAPPTRSFGAQTYLCTGRLRL
jgi:hypothetical protein